MAAIAIALFFAGSFACMVLVQGLYNDGWLFAFRVLGAVELAVAPILIFRWREQLREAMHWRPALTVFLGLVACGGFALLGAPYIFLVNALTTTGETVQYQGIVQSKCIVSGKGRTYVIEISDRKTGRNVELIAKKAEYEGTAIGSYLSRCMNVGGLGLPYVWRYAEPPLCGVA